MENPSPDVLMRTFAEAARERLKKGEAVPLPGLGALRVRHEPSRARTAPDGAQELLPPRDTVVFDPEPYT